MLEALKKNPVTYAMGRFVKARLTDLSAVRSLRQERKIPRTGPIKVGFLCQYTAAWSKVAPIYEKMQQDPRFAPCLICVPSEQVMAKESFATCAENDTYDYFCARGYDAVNALTGANQWLDLQGLDLSYIFYCRPYNHHLPEPYRCRAVSRYSRICLVMYGIIFAQEDMHVAINRDFMSHVSLYFAESQDTQKEFRRISRLPHQLKLQKGLCLGIPALEALQEKKNQPAPAWDFSPNIFRVMWTPRWTTDKALGGSNFFHYYQALLDFAQENPDITFLHRPHPLALTHFQETGEMTAQEAQGYVDRCSQLPNVAIDSRPEYETTFWGSSVLISDISSMVVEYFSIGKPLIFCASNMELALAPYMKELLEGCYVVNNKEELFSTLQMLKNGQDPLAEKRQEICRTLFGNTQDSPSGKILETLAAESQRN